MAVWRRVGRGGPGRYDLWTRASLYALLAVVPVLALDLAAGQRQARVPGLVVFLLLSAAQTVSAQVLADVVRSVHRGGRYVDPELAADAISAGDSPLTAREADVLEFAADGASVEEIAQRAALSPGTVRNYLSSAAAKLSAANRYEAIQKARTNGWI